MVEGATRPARNLAARHSAAFILIARAHGASQASPSASMVAPLQSRKWRLYGSQKRLGHHRRLLGDLFLERLRLEIGMMGENISIRVDDIERNPHSGSRDTFEQTNSRPRPVFTLRSHPRRRLFLLRFALLRPCAPLLPPAGPAPSI